MTKTIEASLFPILDSDPPPRTGIARLAAAARHADDGHLIQFKALEVRSILNKSVSRRQLSLAYSINPYRGCEFACRYCYARYTHEFLAPNSEATISSPDAFEHEIYLKQNAAWLLEQELRHIDPSQEIALGTATDPYQPIERRARITRSLLEVFSRKSGYRLGIVTKSRLITRDIDLLQQIAARKTSSCTSPSPRQTRHSHASWSLALRARICASRRCANFGRQDSLPESSAHRCFPESPTPRQTSMPWPPARPK